MLIGKGARLCHNNIMKSRENLMVTPIVYVSAAHGCVYQLVKDLDSDGDYLICTPQFTDGSYDQDRDNWDEVDEMALLGEEQEIRDHVDFIYDVLKQENELADAIK